MRGCSPAILTVNELIRSGDIKRALVVSGEYLTFLTGSAQRELRDIRDPRLACLTLGDAGICLLLEQGDGFEFMDLYTVPEHADLCVAHWVGPSGPIMFTDSAALARVAMNEWANHLRALVEDHRVVDDPDYVIEGQGLISGQRLLFSAQGTGITVGAA